MIEVYVNRGVIRHRLGNPAGAIPDFDQGFRLDDRPNAGRYARGNAWNALKEFDRASADYDQALALDPNLADAYNNRGIVYFAQGDLEGGVADYSRPIAINPAHPPAYFNRVIALRLVMRYAESANASYDLRSLLGFDS